MICFKGKTFCDNKHCNNINCDRNQSKINKDELLISKLPLCLALFSKDCAYYKELLKKNGA